MASAGSLPGHHAGVWKSEGYQATGVDPFLASKEKGPKGKLSDVGAALNTLKFIIGLGIISLPNATKHVGWLPSVLGLGVVAFVTVWGIFFATQARYKLDQLEEEAAAGNSAAAVSEGQPLVNGSWQDLADSGCGFFDRIVGKVWGPKAQAIFAASIAFGQFTTCVMYIIVIVQNIESYFPAAHAGSPVLIGMIVVLAAFSLTPTLQGVAVLSGLGLCIYAFLFLGLLVELVRKMQSGTLPESAHMLKHIDTSAGQWFGASCFAFSGFPIAMVIHDEMSNPRAFYKVIISVFFIVWVVYSSFAMLGYHCYGDKTQLLIYFNFEEGSIFRNGSAAALAGILCFSFVVQAMPLYNCTARALDYAGVGAAFGDKGVPLPVIRWSVLAATIVCAYVVPSVKVMMDTVGALSGVISGFLFPAVTYLVLSSRDEYLARIRCCIVIAIGVFGCYYSFMDSISSVY